VDLERALALQRLQPSPGTGRHDPLTVEKKSFGLAGGRLRAMGDGGAALTEGPLAADRLNASYRDAVCVRV